MKFLAQNCVSLIAVICGVTAVVATTPAHADVLCVSKTARVNKKGQLPLGAQMFVRAACKSNEVAVLNTSQMTGPKGDPGVIGTAGAQGAKGDKGDTGAVGPKGDPGPGVSWVEASSATEMEANLGYIVTGDTQVDLTLPANLAVGDIIQVREGQQVTPWRLLPGKAGQTVQGAEGMYSAGARAWTDIAVSENGQFMAAVVQEGYIYTSQDAGEHWTERRGAGSKGWQRVFVSNDGMRLVAGASPSQVYASADGGANWVPASGDIVSFGYSSQLTGSKDGTRLYASGGFISFSQDGGVTWSKSDRIGGAVSLGCSSDGASVAVTQFDQSYRPALKTSSDGGQNWTNRSPPEGYWWNTESLRYPALSADGATMYNVVTRNPDWSEFSVIVKSTDGGVSWALLQAAGERPWRELACSADGQTVYASDNAGSIYRSVDAGSSWRLMFRSNGDFESLETNASGSTFYGWRRNLMTGLPMLFSSVRSSFTEIQGSRPIKLIYLGGDTFGQEQSW
jgi:hypothetical protein